MRVYSWNGALNKALGVRRLISYLKSDMAILRLKLLAIILITRLYIEM